MEGPDIQISPIDVLGLKGGYRILYGFFFISNINGEAFQWYTNISSSIVSSPSSGKRMIPVTNLSRKQYCKKKTCTSENVTAKATSARPYTGLSADSGSPSTKRLVKSRRYCTATGSAPLSAFQQDNHNLPNHCL